MTNRGLTRLSWTVFGLVVLTYGAAAIFFVLNRRIDHQAAESPFVSITLVFSMIGVVVTTRQPRNWVGWILQVIGLGWGQYALWNGYALYGLITNPGGVASSQLMLALSSWLWVPSVSLMALLLQLYPDGRPTSSRWSWLLLATLVLTLVMSVAALVTPGPFSNQGFPTVRNPLGLETWRNALGVINSMALLLLLGCIAASVFSLVQRFRYSFGQVRLQIKWVVAAAAIVAFVYVLLMLVNVVEQLLDRSIVPTWLGQLVFPSFLLIPLAIGIAILKYRLYDIDIIINRALVYGWLSLFLGGVYLAAVVILQQLLQPIAGKSPLAVAGSTLVTAALFGPIRSRTQGFIDRRFYREKYDAAKTIEEFTTSLRNEVDLKELCTHLVQVVQATMQPSSVSIWLKDQ